MTLAELKERLELFIAQYSVAPEFGRYNRQFKERMEGKGELLNAFISNLKLWKCLASNDVQIRIDEIITQMKQNLN